MCSLCLKNESIINFHFRLGMLHILDIFCGFYENAQCYGHSKVALQGDLIVSNSESSE